MIYHILPKDVWDTRIASDKYEHPSLIKDGFIHFSLLEQVVFIATLMFPEKRADLILLEVDEKLVTAPVYFEDIQGHGRFPHVYGALNTDAVIMTYLLQIDDRDRSKVSYMLPDALQLPRTKMN